MKHKKLVGCILAAAVTMTSTLAGCSLVSKNSDTDMAQIIAEVNITENLKSDETLSAFTPAIETVSITKRQLVSYYLNVGYSYIQNGSTYREVFTMLVDALVNNAIVSQYSIAYLLNDKAETENKTQASVIAEYTALSSTSEKYEYILGGKDSDYVQLATYSLLTSLNSAIDSYEQSYLEEEDSTAGTETRTTPTNVDTENEDFYPVDKDGNLNYNVYTGFDGYLLSDSGVYADDALEGTTKVTRKRAYTSFVSRLISNNLIDENNQDISDIMALPYITTEYETQLQYQISQKYYDVYEAAQEELLATGSTAAYSYVNSVYQDLLESQKDSYDNDSSAFETALGNMSDSSFVLYTPENDDYKAANGDTTFGGTYGFVYNILLPYSASQSVALTTYQSQYSTTVNGTTVYTPAYYNARNQLLKNITTTDQRSAWFNGATDYSFDATETELKIFDAENKSSYLFFENNMLNNDRYEELNKYIGLYPYNGKVVKNEDTGSYNLLPNTLTIDTMLDEFSSYVNFVLGGEKVTLNKNDNYYDELNENTLYKDKTTKEIDYSKFIYAEGKIDLTDYLKSATLEKGSEQYKALSAVNELQYAYTTDTGVLSQYLGYSVTLGDTTGYIKEFEYAAHKALQEGAGTFVVCAGDYGWHILYVTYSFDIGNQFTPDWSNIDKEGTFEYNFYEWIKSNDIADASSEQSSYIVQKFSSNSVTRYESRYQDLLDMDNA